MRHLLLCCLAVVVAFAQGQHPTLPMQSFAGPCPQFEVSNNYNLEKMMEGVWYHVYASDEVHFNSSMKCIERRYNYVQNDDRLDIDKYYVLNRAPVWSNSSLYTTDKPGVFRHSKDAGPWYKRVDIINVAGDPSTYMAMWGCLYDSKSDTHYESGGISSRKRELSSEDFESIKNLLKAGGAGLVFQPVDWSDCRTANCI